MLAYEIMSVAIRMSILTEKKGEIIRRLTVQTLAMPKGAGIAALLRCIFFAIINHYSAVFSMTMKLQTKHYIRVMILFANTHTTLAQWGFIFNDNAFSLRFLFPLGKK